MAMTEQEWLACSDPQKMLEFVEDKVSDRKLRLFAVACCRRIWHLMSDERIRAAVEVAERYSDGVASPEELDAAQTKVRSCYVEYDPWGIEQEVAEAAEWTLWAVAKEGTDVAAATAARVPGYDVTEKTGWNEARYYAAYKGQSDLFRCLLGSLPFRPVTLNPAWRTSNVTALAQTIYDDRAFDRLPILADALEDAGCDNADILNHCRAPGVHVRGCWVVDLLLGRE
jgi:hypothetical protein